MSVTQEKTSKVVQVSTLTGFGISVVVHVIIFLLVGTVVIFEGKMPQNLFVGDLSGSDLAPSSDEMEIPLLEEEPMDVQLDDPALEMMNESIQQSIEPAINTNDLIMSTQVVAPTFSIPLNTSTGPINPAAKLTAGTSGKKLQPGVPSGAKTMFGFTKAFSGALEGTMIDFKQDKNGKPTRMKSEAFRGVINDFAKRSNWNLNKLDDYYIVDKKMYTTHIFFPGMSANVAPKAFGVEKIVEPKMWAILYKGNFTSPVTGKFRFYGSSDDYLFVKVDGEPVLDAGLMVCRGDEKSSFMKNVDVVPDISFRRQKFPTVSRSDWIEFSQGSSHTIEILVSERPGGTFFAFLFIEEEGEKYKKDHRDRPIWPLFQTADADIDIKPVKDQIPEIGKRPVIFGP